MRAIAEQACTISKTGSVVIIECDDADYANDMLNWLCKAPEVIKEAQEWLRAIRTWLLETDNDMWLPQGILDIDPIDIVERLSSGDFE